MIRLALVSLLLPLLSQVSAAQSPEPLFVHQALATAPAGVAGSARPGVVNRAQVGLRINRIFSSQGVWPRILLNTGEHSWTARFERLDIDSAGFRSWVGSIEGISESHVVFTERHGIVSGLINAVGTTYQIRTETPGAYLLERVDVARLGDEHDPVAIMNSAPAASDRLDVVRDDASTIDVLMLYTPSARAHRGGTPQIQALVSQVISDTNTAFARSGVASRVRLVAALELSLNEAPLMSSDLFALSASQEAQLLRDAARADLVQLLVHSPDLSSCGVGHLLTSLNSTSFSAYSVADVDCAAQYTPTHEMGHNMGSHHAPEDGASGALFPYSYGFKDPVRQFRTVMAYGCASSSCGRVLNFSNPGVIHAGGPTGTQVQDNTRSLNGAMQTVANFRQATSLPMDLPPPPSGLRSTAFGNEATVSWDDVPSTASAFVLQVGTSHGAADILSRSVYDARSASGALGNGTYFWRVFSLNASGPSGPSAEGQFTVGSCPVPSAPTNFSFGLDGGHVTLAWTPPTTGSDPFSYIVEAGSESGLANLLVAQTGPATSVGTLAPPGAYFVRVRAQNSCGTSGPSNEQLITIP